MTARSHDGCLGRRHFLGSGAMGLGAFGLAHLLGRDGLLAADGPAKPPLEKVTHDLTPKKPHFAPKANAMISLFMGGGPSSLDLLDPKPKLNELDGKLFAGDIQFDNAGGASKVIMGSPFRFKKHGQCGTEVSELLPHTAGIVDDITVVRSMNLGGIRNHVAGMRAMDTGRGPAGRPALGSWLTYGLGSESLNLPAFVALVIRKDPPGSPFWGSGLLPSIYQGTHVREEEPRIMNLDPPPHMKGAPQDLQLSLLGRLNRQHLDGRPGESDLQARIACYELAARMQTAASDALDVTRESKETRALYGADAEDTRRLGEACLIARRLVERGVRFVQIWDYAWDMHESINTILPKKCLSADKPCAALVSDLKRRGMLDRTLVYWGGEMGRLPVVPGRGGAKGAGRDHNTDGFSVWLAGGGVKGGHVHGATDEFGLNAVEGVVRHTDYLATVVHLFGFDPAKLTYQRNGGGGDPSRRAGRRGGEGSPGVRRWDDDPGSHARSAPGCRRDSLRAL